MAIEYEYPPRTAETVLRVLLQPGATVYWYADATRDREPWQRLFVASGDKIHRITVDVARLLGIRRLRNGRYAGKPWVTIPALAETLFGDRDALREEEL